VTTKPAKKASSKATPGGVADKFSTAANVLRPSLLIGEVKPGKDGAEQWVRAGGLTIYSESTVEAARRLLNDERAAKCWRDDLGAAQFEEAVHCYELATGRGAWAAWDGKTRRERGQWKRQFATAITRLLGLMEEGPTPPKVYGYPAGDYVLMEVLRRVGHPVPSPGDADAFFRKMVEVDDAVEDLPWTIADALLQYRKKVEIDAENAILPLKRPRDPKAGRAKFIVNFRHYSGCSVPVVAAVAAAMFDDEVIDERLVRRLTSTRADS
jgi:hypothetical protein